MGKRELVKCLFSALVKFATLEKMLGHVAARLVIRVLVGFDGLLACLPTALGRHQRRAEIILCFLKVYVEKKKVLFSHI